MLSSISPDVIAYISREYPELPTGQVFWLTSSTYLPIGVLTEGLYEDVLLSGADYILLHTENLRNLENLLRLKPTDKTIIFWDFGDSMYLVHKDAGDRLWGPPSLRGAWQRLKYSLINSGN